ncbi:hypothetical protein EYF80_028813 [Liparis tanakae]|uniref:Uncharacterized protein n=1 Tax=Liparis tanakae TaxID=230148 RepID=A0A4Z2H7E6_9TELE|nr:hypothetical protein EYF80_028813 [Liparis tanakae]
MSRRVPGHRSLPRPPSPGLTSSSFSSSSSSSSSGWQWRWGSWQQRRLFTTEPFLSGFSPFFTRGRASPSAGLVAGLSVIAGRRWWSRCGELAYNFR